MAGSGGTESLLVDAAACSGGLELGRAHSPSTTSLLETEGSCEYADVCTIPGCGVNLQGSMHTGHSLPVQRPHLQLGQHPHELQGALPSEMRQARQPTPFVSRAGSEAESVNGFQAGPHFVSNGRETQQIEIDGMCAESGAAPSQSPRVRQPTPFASLAGSEVSSDDHQPGSFNGFHVDPFADIGRDSSQADTAGAACRLRPPSPQRNYAPPSVHTYRMQAAPPPPERRGASALSPRRPLLRPPGHPPTPNANPMRESPQSDARYYQPRDVARPRAASVPRPEASVAARPPSPGHRQPVQQASNSATGCGAGQQDLPIDMPRLIWQLEKQHATLAGRLQAELRSLRQEFAVLRGELDSTRSSQRPLQVPQAVPITAADPKLAASLAGEVEQLRHEVLKLRERVAGNWKETSEAVGSLREDLNKCFAEAAASASAAKSAARSSAKLIEEADEMHSRSAVADSIERRVHALEEAQLTQRNASSPFEENTLEVKAQVATLERQMDHLRDVSAEASRNSEQDQATLCALLRTSRALAERLGVGPVLLGRESHHNHSAKGLVAEAESLAASVAAGWRRQKASGVIPAGAANILEAMHLQRSSKGSPFASAKGPCGRDGIADLGNNDEHTQRHAIPTAPMPLVDRVLYCTEGPAAGRDRSWYADPCSDYDPEQRKLCFAYT